MAKPEFLVWRKPVLTMPSGATFALAVGAITRVKFDDKNRMATMFWTWWRNEAAYLAQSPELEGAASSHVWTDDHPIIVVESEEYGPDIYSGHIRPGLNTTNQWNKFRPLIKYFVGEDITWL